MRSTSPTSARLSSSTRIFVTLTGAEAAALGRLSRDGDVEAIRALAKIRTALEHALADGLSPEPSALSSEPAASAVPPLRAKHYRARPREPLRLAKADMPVKVSIDTAAAAPERLRMAKAALPAKGSATVLERASTARRERDYVPYRDEADGVYT